MEETKNVTAGLIGITQAGEILHDQMGWDDRVTTLLLARKELAASPGVAARQIRCKTASLTTALICTVQI